MLCRRSHRQGRRSLCCTQCNPTSSTKGYLVAELGGRNGSLTAITLPLGLNTAETVSSYFSRDERML